MKPPDTFYYVLLLFFSRIYGFFQLFQFNFTGIKGQRQLGKGDFQLAQLCACVGGSGICCGNERIVLLLHIAKEHGEAGAGGAFDLACSALCIQLYAGDVLFNLGVFFCLRAEKGKFFVGSGEGSIGFFQTRCKAFTKGFGFAQRAGELITLFGEGGQLFIQLGQLFGKFIPFFCQCPLS